MSEPPFVKDEYEAAVHKYKNGTSISGFIMMFFMFFPPLLGLIFIDDLYERDTTQNGAEHCLWIGIGLGLYLLIPFILPITCAIFYDNRLKRNLRLNCPLCDEFIGMETQSIHILKTGMCSECKEMLFEGEFASKKEALQYYHQLEVDDNQKNKSAMKFTARFAVLASILALIPSLLIYIWIKRINESMEVTGPSIGKFLFPCLIVPLIFCFISRLSLKECERRGEKLKETAHEMNFRSLKGDSNN